MKVILTDDVANLGSCGETVKVKTGYARNYLIPRNMAVPASKGNLRAVDHLKDQKELRDKKRRRSAEKIRDSLEKLSLTAQLTMGEEDQVFGSITIHTIAELIEQEGGKVEKRWIQLEEPIKALGLFTVKIRIEKDVEAGVKLLVEKKIA